MDINCIYPCRYQKEGKCTLQSPTSISSQFKNVSHVDCPYYDLPDSTLDNKTPSRVQ
ncbi:MAG: hypothetical protein GX238_06005 [Epulopiscium sp.]|nr:hypothetical protein [Candidatus Epulonipiscium sp.]